MSKRSGQRVIPLPQHFVVKQVLRLANSVPRLSGCVDIARVVTALQPHTTAAHAGKGVREVGSHLLEGICSPTGKAGLSAEDVADLAEESMREFGHLNGYLIDWSSCSTVDELNQFIDDSFAGDDVSLAARRWIRAHLMPSDEEQSWDWSEPDPEPADKPLRAVVLGPITSLSKEERLQFVGLARAATEALEAHGFVVYCPVINPNLGFTDAELAAIDMEAIGGASFVVALMAKPAHGVGVGVGATARTRPPVLILGPENTDLTPLTGVVDDPVLLPAASPSEVRQRIEQFLSDHRVRVEEHAKAVQRRREQALERFERFKAAVRLESEFPLDLADLRLSKHVKMTLCTSLDGFMAALALGDDISAYIERVERAVAERAQLDGDESPVVAGPAALSEAASAWSVEDSVGLQGMDEFAQSGLPRAGAPTEDSEQLTLFGLASAPTPAVPKQKRPSHWRDLPFISPREMASALVAFDLASCDQDEIAQIVDHVAGIRCDQQLLAAGGGGVSDLRLDLVETWTFFVTTLRGQG